MSRTTYRHRVSTIYFTFINSHNPMLTHVHPQRSSVFLNTALIQWAFNVKPDPSAPIDDLAFTASANTHPLPFKVIFEPRVAKTMDGVRELLEDYAL
jgi:hypothetical protein